MSFISFNVSKDAFGLQEVATPQVDFDAQLTYDGVTERWRIIHD